MNSSFMFWLVIILAVIVIGRIAFVLAKRMMPQWWEAIGAIAEVIAAAAMVVTVYYAYQTVKEANEDSKENRDQQLAIFRQSETNQFTRIQAFAMSSCMQEYFSIRDDIAKEWALQYTNAAQTNRIQAMYSERMYGLHFEEYHLFRQDAIPTHVYTIWIKSVKSDIQQTNAYYPQLNFAKYMNNDPNEDFNSFMWQVLGCKSDEEVEALVKKEADRPLYQ